MKTIADVDKNFKVETKLEKEDIKFYNVRTAPFKVYGLMYENGSFKRMPEDVAKTVNDGVAYLHTNTAGGRVVFKTNSPYVAISAKMNEIGKMPHFPLTGSAGFDLYVKNSGKEEYYEGFIPPFQIESGYEKLVAFEKEEEREIIVNFPLYSNVSELFIGLSEKAAVSEANIYTDDKPIVYYGSSVTQGGCASRPGNSYQNIISREINRDYINLGFSGSARGEDAMAEYIKKLDMSLFVYDYDHNAPTPEHLEKTHEKMFKAIREANPDLPIILMTRPVVNMNETEKRRIKIIETTFQNAIDRGDKNVYLILGSELFSICKNDGFVDKCHPNDFGFYSMAQALIKTMKKIF